MSTLFVRQVLGVGLENKSIVKRYGKYIADFVEISKYKIESNDFNRLWNGLKSEFDKYCVENKISKVSEQIFEDLVFDLIDSFRVKNIIDKEWIIEEEDTDASFHWHVFVKNLADSNSELFDFIAYLSASRAYKEVLFFSGNQDAKFDGLNVYLDSPMIFALLEMDSIERTEAYKKLLSDTLAKRCNVYILDNCFEEVSGIVNRAGGWATSSAYDISKANKVAKYFHDMGMSHNDIVEYAESLEDRLNELGITVKYTSYDELSNLFQEDEKILFDMVKEKYLEHHMSLSLEKIESINCDIKSIVMIYRERKGKTATRIQTCSEIMLTTNGALANVCKQYELKQSKKSGHIPACISADLFGAILWLNSPIENLEYQKKKILADCYSALQPSKRLLVEYVNSLENALKHGEIDEKKYLFLRSHRVVVDSLMGITKGDYACFDDQTYIEVYDEINAKARKEYLDEKISHSKTIEKLATSDQEKSQIIKELNNVRRELEESKREQQKRDIERYEKKCKRWSILCEGIVITIPYIFINVIIQFYSAKFTNEVSIVNVVRITAIIIVSIIMKLFFSKIKKFINYFIHKVIRYD